MADMKNYIGKRGGLYDFFLENDLIDSVSLLNPNLEEDSTYFYGSKWIYFIFMTPTLVEMALKASCHQFHQHFISDYKGVYVQFSVDKLFDTHIKDKRHASYMKLKIGRRNIVQKYIDRLEELYTLGMRKSYINRHIGYHLSYMCQYMR